MSRRIGRRVVFFAATSMVCLMLVPFTPSEFQWVAWFAVGLAAFWAIMIAIEDLTAPRYDTPADDAPDTGVDPGSPEAR